MLVKVVEQKAQAEEMYDSVTPIKDVCSCGSDVSALVHQSEG